MSFQTLKLVLVSTPKGFIGSGIGGGVELTLISLIKGLHAMGHQLTLVAPKGSQLPDDCPSIEIVEVSGEDQPSWQHQEVDSSIVIPFRGVLPKLFEVALNIGQSADAVLNFSYDWLPIWITPYVQVKIFHLISMGAVSYAMKSLINQLGSSQSNRFAFHTYRQASDYDLIKKPLIVGNGFDLKNYEFQPQKNGPLGWVGRVAPEKGLEDAVAVASALNEKLLVWGCVEDEKYASAIEASYTKGTILWKGYLKTNELQKELGACRALLNTPKWNEAYGNVVVESLACGVPVIAYNRGGPGELIQDGKTGWVVTSNQISELILAVKNIDAIDRRACREWVEKSASVEVFAKNVESWICKGINHEKSQGNI